ncbi:redoxin domain-containing protein [Paenarthrobacter sp. DKR-5]|uniref:redoxin domain-containing protein n=1 Tax=Paenarthrobacter sp. DKR-5 TaxID=2835535 RepID=UPI001BDCB57F|nr:redoxin domain-containing protein [Paenarthrobacter sp. DKR-5]MBT1003813.1 redoxin domain-containing protein [Paenarthrobacter sp. DKR-5]
MTVPPQDSPQTSGGTGKGPALLWAAAALAIALAVAGIFLTAGGHGHPAAAAAAAAPVEPGINTAASELIQLDVLPAPPRTAPDFHLTDQHGRAVSLSQFRGKSVVLSFNDDRCQDLCTLLAQDVSAANQDLGSAARNVVFLSVNVNPFHPAVNDVRAWTQEHGLGNAANWIYATGSDAQLKATAAKYYVPVSTDPKTGEVTHGSELFFIDPSGKQVAMGQFGTESANTALFAHAMAQMAADLLPDAGSIRVSGPQPAEAAAGTPALNQPAPGFTLPVLSQPESTTSLRAQRGKYTVLNFWAGTCSACVSEMPALEKAHRELGPAVSFLGVDVADPAGSGTALARHSGTTYPLLTDRTGTTAAAYAIPGLPFTAIIGPDGKLLVRHPGTFSTQQLEYILNTLDSSLK